MKMINIGVLGGTFDPPHNGHLDMAKAVLDAKLVDHVWYLPCWKHAFGKNPTDFASRLVMCAKATKDEEHISVCADEAEIKSTYSIEILTYLKDKNPDKNLRLIMGADNYWNQHKWENIEKVFELAPPIWVQRPGIDRVPEEEQAVDCNTNISSTIVRNTIKGFELSMNEMLNPEVKQYIIDGRMYT